MIFQHTHELVASGRKTATSRAVKPDWVLVPTMCKPSLQIELGDSIHVITMGGRMRHYIGQRIAVQPGRGHRAIGHVIIERMRLMDVRKYTPDIVQAEGFDTHAEFMDVWQMMHPAKYMAVLFEFRDFKRVGKGIA